MADMNGDSSILNSGRDASGRFVNKQVIMAAAQRQLAAAHAETGKAQKQIDRLRGAYSTLQKQVDRAFKSQSSGWKAAQSQLAKSLKTQMREQSRFYAQVERLRQRDQKLAAKLHRQQLAEFQKLAREKIKAARQGYASGRSGGLFGGAGLGGMVAPILTTAAIYAVYKKVQDMSAPFLAAELNRRGSVADIRNAMKGITNVPMSKGAELVGKFQGLGKAQFFGAGPQQIAGLARLQSELAKGAGVETATQLVEDLAKSYGDATDRLNAFLAAAGTGNIEQVLRQFASGQNIIETTRAINALSIATDASKGKLDPLVETNLKLTTTIDKLNATLERFVNDLLPKMLPYLEKGAALIEQWADKLSKVDVGTLALVGGGLLGARVVGGGAVKLAGRGAVAGVGALANPVGAALAVGTAGALAIDKYRDKDKTGALGWYLNSRSAQAGVADQWAASQAEAAQRAAGATNQLDRLRAQRDELRSQIGAIPHAWGGGFSEENQDVVNRLRVQYGNVNRQLQKLRAEQEKTAKTAQAGTPKHRELWESISSGAKSAAEWVAKYGRKLQDAANADKVRKLQEQASRQQQAGLNAQVANALTAEAKARLEYARSSPFGPEFGMLQALPEFEALQKTIRDEVAKLEKQLSLIDTSTEQGTIEASGVRRQILDLRREEKAGRIEMLQGLTGGYLDAIQAQAFGAGRFERFLVTSNSNLGKGLEKGMVHKNPLLGAAGQDALGMSATPFQFSPDWSRNMSDFARYQEQLSRQWGRFSMPVPGAAMDMALVGAMPQAAVRPQVSAPSGSSGSAGSKTVNPNAKTGTLLQDAGKWLIQAGQKIIRETEAERSSPPIVRAS